MDRRFDERGPTHEQPAQGAGRTFTRRIECAECAESAAARGRTLGPTRGGGVREPQAREHFRANRG